jgi:hypothetical protein
MEVNKPHNFWGFVRGVTTFSAVNLVFSVVKDFIQPLYWGYSRF